MGCGASSPANGGSLPEESQPQPRPRSGRPVRREPRALNSRHGSPNASSLHLMRQADSGASSRRGSGQFLQVASAAEAGASNSNHHHHHQDSVDPLVMLANELNRQRREIFAQPSPVLRDATGDDGAAIRTVAMEAAAAAAAASTTDGSSAKADSKGCHVITRILSLQESQNLPLYLTNLMSEVKSKSEETDGTKADLCFWTKEGHFDCATVRFTKSGTGRSEAGAEDDNNRLVALSMVFLPSGSARLEATPGC